MTDHAAIIRELVDVPAMDRAGLFDNARNRQPIISITKDGTGGESTVFAGTAADGNDHGIFVGIAADENDHSIFAGVAKGPAYMVLTTFIDDALGDVLTARSNGHGLDDALRILGSRTLIMSMTPDFVAVGDLGNILRQSAVVAEQHQGARITVDDLVTDRDQIAKRVIETRVQIEYLPGPVLGSPRTLLAAFAQLVGHVAILIANEQGPTR